MWYVCQWGNYQPETKWHRKIATIGHRMTFNHEHNPYLIRSYKRLWNYKCKITPARKLTACFKYNTVQYNEEKTLIIYSNNLYCCDFLKVNTNSRLTFVNSGKVPDRYIHWISEWVGIIAILTHWHYLHKQHFTIISEFTVFIVNMHGKIIY